MCAARILFKLSGSISAWKACAVISRLVQDGHEVQTVASAAALRFVGAATLEGLTGRSVASDLWEHGRAMDHINLTKWADVVVLCPATANTLNKLAAGTGDDLLSALFLAHDWRKPYLIAPAMNPAMWSHPATIESCDRLKSWGVRILPVGRGRLACGDEGEGRLSEPEEILAAIRDAGGPARFLPDATAGPRLRVLITSGGTEEPVDGVRTLGNFSTGRTGAQLADAFHAAGHEVTLLRSHRVGPAGAGVREETFTTFADLSQALERLLHEKSFDVVIHAAAVGDYSVEGLLVDGAPVPAGSGKIGSGHQVSVQLRPNPKLVDQLRTWSANPDLRLIAFKLTRDADAEAIRSAVDTLFAHSHADVIVHNDLSQLGADADRFPATIYRPDHDPIPVATRGELAAALVRQAAPTNTIQPV